MARQTSRTKRNAYRALARIRRKAEHRAEQIARTIVEAIHINAPEDEHHDENTGGPKLKDSYYVKQDPETGDFIIGSRRRYWAFVEFGTKEHGKAQPHVRPAIDAARRFYR